MSVTQIAEGQVENETEAPPVEEQQKAPSDPTKIEVIIEENEPQAEVVELVPAKEPDELTQSEVLGGQGDSIGASVSPREEGAAVEDTISARIALPHTFSSNYFLNKHTHSFKCLEQYLCSQSDLRLTLNFFPPLLDPGLDDALNFIPPEEEPDPNGVDKYIKMCKDLTIVPISRVIKSLGTDTLNLTYYGISLSQMRGIADALKVNSNIKYLIFQDNWMSPEATSLISAVLQESNSIRVLNLKECRIGEEGAERLSEGIASTTLLQELDISYNSLGDNGLKILQPCLIENASIKKLNISHNNLTEESGPTMEQILLENKTLEELDLAWNGFYTGPGNKKICNGLTKNEQISWLNLSFNGIGTAQAMRPITKYLRKTEILQFLDLSWNRITLGALKLLRGALVRNKSLQQVKLGNNTYTSDEAYFLASVLTKSKSGNIEYIDMEDMCVNKDFLQLKNQLRRKGKTITHGHVLNNYQIYGPNINELLFKRCKYLAMKPKKKKTKKDFGHFVLALPDKPMTTQDFFDFIKKKKIKKLDKDLLNELMTRFPAKGKKIDCVKMKEAYLKLWPDTVLPEEKKKKKGKGKKRKKKK